jgi:hypothetical protein
MDAVHARFECCPIRQQLALDFRRTAPARGAYVPAVPDGYVLRDRPAQQWVQIRTTVSCLREKICRLAKDL